MEFQIREEGLERREIRENHLKICPTPNEFQTSTKMAHEALAMG